MFCGICQMLCGFDDHLRWKYVAAILNVVIGGEASDGRFAIVAIVAIVALIVLASAKSNTTVDGGVSKDVRWLSISIGKYEGGQANVECVRRGSSPNHGCHDFY